jgi:hypothetical protein
MIISENKKRSLIAGPLLLAIILQSTLLLLTVFIGVVIPNLRNQPNFKAKKVIYLPQRQLEHKVNVAEFQNTVQSPIKMEKLRTSALLPDISRLPILPDINFSPVETESPLISPDALVGQTDFTPSLFNAKASTASLFGIEDSGQRILILFDDGGSVLTKARKSGVSIHKIKEEVIKLIDGLNANTLFGLINFVRQIGTFNDYLVPATVENKKAARQWIQTHFGTRRKNTSLCYDINGIQGAFQVGFQMNPDIIFLISDADFQRSTDSSRGEDVPWEQLKQTLQSQQKDIPKKVRIHFIGFQVEEVHSSEMMRIIKRYGGKSRKIQ